MGHEVEAGDLSRRRKALATGPDHYGRRMLGRSANAVVVSVCGLLLTAAPAAPAPSILTILAIGDSFTAGLGLARNAAFPARLEAELRSQGMAVRVVNAGVSGDTTTSGRARLEVALAEKPSLVILELGANDALRGVDPAIVYANLREMIIMVHASGAKLLLTGMLAPPNWGEQYRRAFDLIYPELARAYGVPLYPFFLQGVALDAQLNQPDGLHPNKLGVAVLVDRIAPVVAHLILDVNSVR